MVRTVLFLGLRCVGILQRIKQSVLLFAAHGLETKAHHVGRYVFLVDHKADEHILVWQFLRIVFGHKAVQHIVVFNGGVASDGLETAVVVGENESVGTDNHARTVARKADNAVLDGVVIVVKCAIGQRKTLAFHLIKDSLWQVIKRPHALIGT